jgi:hypothetical protein
MGWIDGGAGQQRSFAAAQPIGSCADKAKVEPSGLEVDQALAQIELIWRNVPGGSSSHKEMISLRRGRSIMQNIRTGTLLSALAVIGLFGCVDTSGTQQRRTLNEAEFQKEIVGTRLVWEDGETRYFADGTFSGITGGEILQGEWEFKNGKYCRTGAIGGDPFPYACETVTIAGRTVTFSGTGTKYIYTIKK